MSHLLSLFPITLSHATLHSGSPHRPPSHSSCSVSDLSPITQAVDQLLRHLCCPRSALPSPVVEDAPADNLTPDSSPSRLSTHWALEFPVTHPVAPALVPSPLLGQVLTYPSRPSAPASARAVLLYLAACSYYLQRLKTYPCPGCTPDVFSQSPG